MILRRIDDINLLSYFLVLQRLNNIQRDHCELKHNKARNLTELLRLKVWWPSLLHGVKEVLE